MAFKRLLIVCLIIAVSSLEEEPGSQDVIKSDAETLEKGITAEEIKKLVDLTRAAEMEAGRKIPEPLYPTRVLRKDTVKKLLSKVKMSRIEGVVQKLSSFHSRNALEYYGASEAEGWLTEELKKILVNFKGSSSIKFISNPRLQNHKPNIIPYRQENIIVRMEGQDNAKKEQLVILGAHYDSIIGFEETAWIQNRKNRAPGADDNATGCAVLMEVLRLLVQSGIKLNHALEFHFYAATEINVAGAYDVGQLYKKKNVKVKGLLSLDSLGHGTVIGFIGRNAALNTFVKMLVNEYTDKVPLREIDCEATCPLDFFAWHLVNIPSVSVRSFNLSPRIHTDGDTFDAVNFELVNQFLKVATAYVVELGEAVAISSGWKMQLQWIVMGASFVGIWLLF
ncbi:unnamed protein product [Orchesella dallaii]|uniref:Peptidase M28 domain-containing protein n=1 Tax=Orchesella dallaii TaxID=48710 RepID=A0ABP1S4Q6_9HEXA